MPRITDIIVQKGDSARVNVYLDGDFACGISAMVALTRELHPGMELTDADVNALQQDEDAERAYAAALGYLSYRPRSSAEIRTYLAKRKTDSGVVETALERLARAGLVDDGEFARYWVENRQSFRPRGTRALRAEMRQKGLSAEVINDALEGLDDEESTAYAVGLKKFGSFEGLAERDFVHKMVAYLQRRGFPHEACISAARHLWRDSQDAAFDSTPE